MRSRGEDRENEEPATEAKDASGHAELLSDGHAAADPFADRGAIIARWRRLSIRYLAASLRVVLSAFRPAALNGQGSSRPVRARLLVFFPAP